MNYLTYLTLALTLAVGSQATTCVPASGSKKTVCNSLSSGGLANLNLLGCSNIDISPSLNILKRMPVNLRHAARHSKETDNTSLCSDMSKAGLINLSVLGCSDTTLSPTLDILQKRGLEHYPVAQQKSICASLSGAKFINRGE